MSINLKPFPITMELNETDLQELHQFIYVNRKIVREFSKFQVCGWGKKLFSDYAAIHQIDNSKNGKVLPVYVQMDFSI